MYFSLCPGEVEVAPESEQGEQSKTPSKGSCESIAQEVTESGKSSPKPAAPVLEEMELTVTVDDSDYYTPDDPPTTVLSPLHTADKVEFFKTSDGLPRVTV